MTMTITLYLLTLVLPLMTILIIFVLRYYAGIQQAKAWQAHEDAYRQLAERVATVQSQIATSMAAVESNLSDMRTRMAAVENILKAVE
jgi:hypothetical protein